MISLVSDILNLVPRRSLLTHCRREVWERVGESLSVTSQLTVESRFDRAEYAEGLGWDIPCKQTISVRSQYIMQSTTSLHSPAVFIYLHNNVLLIHP